MGIADGWNFKGGSSGLRAADPCGLEQRARDGGRRCARLFEAAARADACMDRLPLRDRTEGTRFTHDPSPGTKPTEESHDADATCGPPPAEASSRRSLRDRVRCDRPTRRAAEPGPPIPAGSNRSAPVIGSKSVNRPQPSGGGIGRDARCSPPPRERLRAADLCEVETVWSVRQAAATLRIRGAACEGTPASLVRVAGLRQAKLRPADPCGIEPCGVRPHPKPPIPCGTDPHLRKDTLFRLPNVPHARSIGRKGRPTALTARRTPAAGG